MKYTSKKRSDVQADDSLIKLGLQRVGVSNIPKIIKRKWKGQYNELAANIDVYVDLLPTQRGIHMSRNIEAINDVTTGLSPLFDEIISNTEDLCMKIAEKVLSTQSGAKFAEVHLTADYEVETFSEALFKNKASVHKLHAGAKAEQLNGKLELKKIIGAEVEGITVCPCSYELSKDYAKEKLAEKGFNNEQIQTIVELVPFAAHNQRSKTTLLFELPESAERLELNDIIKVIEISVSAPLHEILKRKDEQAVVIYAHSRPRFVEDVVRILLQNIVFTFNSLPHETVIYIKQENYESIHHHNAVAEVMTTFANLQNSLNLGE